VKLENEFDVAASIDDTWETLMDIERVATCLPGAKIEPSDEDGVYRGAMKVKFGPVTVSYKGTAQFQDVDEDGKTASIAVQARETKGQGTAAAVISNHLEQVNGKTRVVAITDLKVTGRPAQFGRGIMEDVASAMMEKFAQELEREIQSGGAKAAPTGPAANGQAPGAAAPPRPSDLDEEDDVLDMGSVLANTEMLKYGVAAGAGLLVLLVIGLLLGNRKKRLTLNINLNR
jgi:carbon monoxide dehydrogenase subunit G